MTEGLTMGALTAMLAKEGDTIRREEADAGPTWKAGSRASPGCTGKLTNGSTSRTRPA